MATITWTRKGTLLLLNWVLSYMCVARSTSLQQQQPGGRGVLSRAGHTSLLDRQCVCSVEPRDA